MIYKSRKLVDLVKHAVDRWPTLEPTRPVEPGDYGHIDEESGELEIHGNIYKDIILDMLPELVEDKYKPVLGEKRHHWTIASYRTRHTDVTIDANEATDDLPEGSVKAHFIFRNNFRGCYMMMYDIQTFELPKNVLLEKLHKLPPLDELLLVTGVVSCSAYAFYLSDLTSEEKDVTFVPVGSGKDVKPGWDTDRKGLYQEGFNPAGERSFRPLYTLKRMRNVDGWPNFRDSPPPQRKGDLLWLPAYVPWIGVDNDGDEEEFMDDLPNSDSD